LLSPILAALLHATRAAVVNQTLWRGIAELLQRAQPIFGWAAITLGIGPHSSYGHYIFALWFLSFFFFSLPNLSGRILDVYHTSRHGGALVRI